mmetsp:Transcript_36198/g.82107  ORF Transcript_36198/g.82107 Transcript_36198/m.82107 type:complete len:260 (-) Transcript_36198:83-862(-)
MHRRIGRPRLIEDLVRARHRYLERRVKVGHTAKLGGADGDVGQPAHLHVHQPTQHGLVPARALLHLTVKELEQQQHGRHVGDQHARIDGRERRDVRHRVVAAVRGASRPGRAEIHVAFVAERDGSGLREDGEPFAAGRSERVALKDHISRVKQRDTAVRRPMLPQVPVVQLKEEPLPTSGLDHTPDILDSHGGVCRGPLSVVDVRRSVPPHDGLELGARAVREDDDVARSATLAQRAQQAVPDTHICVIPNRHDQIALG